jgi:MFS family permease
MPGAWRVPAFRRLWVAGLVSDTGDWLLLVALPVLVYQLTGSALGTAGAFLVELAPPVLLAPLLGAVADRFDRRRTLLVVSAAQAAALLPLLAVHGRTDLPLVYGVIAVQSALAALFDPTKNALLPTQVPPTELVSANALIGLNQNLGRLLGGPLGGLLLAGHALPVIVLVDAASFFLAATLIATVPTTRHPRPNGVQAYPGERRESPGRPGIGRRSPGRAGIARPGIGRLGIAKVLGEKWIRGALVTMGLAGAAQGIFVVLFVVFVARLLHGDAAETGLLRGVQAVGSIVAGAALAVAGRRGVGWSTGGRSAGGRSGAGWLTAGSAGAFGLVALVTWNLPAVTLAEPVYVVLFVLVGAPGLVMFTGLTTSLQETAPEAVRGRVLSVAGAVSAIGQAAGMLAAGVLTDRTGLLTLLDAQGVLYLLAAGTAWWWLVRAGRPAASPVGIAEVEGVAGRR